MSECFVSELLLFHAVAWEQVLIISAERRAFLCAREDFGRVGKKFGGGSG